MKKNLKNVVLGLAQSDHTYGITRDKKKLNFKDVISYSLTKGITNFDTAPNYLGSEKIVKEICSLPINISSKLPLIECPLSELKTKVVNEIENIFNRNKLNKIENLFLHDPLLPLDKERWLIVYKILLSYKKKNRINNIGVSIYNKKEIEDILKVFKPDIVQFPYNVFNQSFDNNFLKYLKQKRIHLQARSIFLQGILLGKVKNKYFKIWKKNFELWEKYTQFKSQNKLGNCLSLILNNKYIDSVVIGVENANQLEQIIKIFKFKKFPQKNEDIKKFKISDEYLIDPRLWGKNKNFDQKKIWDERCKYIFNGGMLISKNPNQFLPGKWPSSYYKAKDCKIWVNKKNYYYDFAYMGVGTNILGYSNKKVNNYVKKIIDNSSNSSLNSDIDLDLSKEILSFNKWANKCFFSRTGAEANAIALRISRCFSKKDAVAVCGYHGWHDWYLSTNLENSENLSKIHLQGLDTVGIPGNLKKTTFPFQYNDIGSFKKIINSKKNIGTVFMEVQRNIKPKKNFLEEIRKITKKKKITLIFDECTSGFRENYGGLYKKYNVEPDIVVYGKAIGNGFPITAVVTKNELFEHAKESFISSTFWSERVGPAAAIASLREMKRTNSWKEINKIGKKIKKFWKLISKKYNVKTSITGLDSIPTLNFLSKKNLYYKTFVTQELLKKRILSNNTIYCSIAHKKYLGLYFQEFEKIFKKISDCENGESIIKYLEHPLCKPGFQRLN